MTIPTSHIELGGQLIIMTNYIRSGTDLPAVVEPEKELATSIIPHGITLVAQFYTPATGWIIGMVNTTHQCPSQSGTTAPFKKLHICFDDQ